MKLTYLLILILAVGHQSFAATKFCKSIDGDIQHTPFGIICNIDRNAHETPVDIYSLPLGHSGEQGVLCFNELIYSKNSENIFATQALNDDRTISFGLDRARISIPANVLSNGHSKQWEGTFLGSDGEPKVLYCYFDY